MSNAEVGFWGGLTALERNRIRARAGLPRLSYRNYGPRHDDTIGENDEDSTE